MVWHSIYVGGNIYVFIILRQTDTSVAEIAQKLQYNMVHQFSATHDNIDMPSMPPCFLLYFFAVAVHFHHTFQYSDFLKYAYEQILRNV